MPESFAHAKMRTGKIIHAVNFDTVPHQRLVLKDGEPYEFTRFMATRHSIVGNPDSYVNGKLNGVRIPSLILRELQGSAEYNPLILEFVLGLLHTTSVVDGYVVQHWAAHADRIGNKAPKCAAAAYVSQECAPLYPDRKYMDALISANLMKGVSNMQELMTKLVGMIGNDLTMKIAALVVADPNLVAVASILITDEATAK